MRCFVSCLVAAVAFSAASADSGMVGRVKSDYRSIESFLSSPVDVLAMSPLQPVLARVDVDQFVAATADEANVVVTTLNGHDFVHVGNHLAGLTGIVGAKEAFATNCRETAAIREWLARKGPASKMAFAKQDTVFGHVSSTSEWRSAAISAAVEHKSSAAAHIATSLTVGCRQVAVCRADSSWAAAIDLEAAAIATLLTGKPNASVYEQASKDASVLPSGGLECFQMPTLGGACSRESAAVIGVELEPVWQASDVASSHVQRSFEQRLVRAEASGLVKQAAAAIVDAHAFVNDRWCGDWSYCNYDKPRSKQCGGFGGSCNGVDPCPENGCRFPGNASIDSAASAAVETAKALLSIVQHANTMPAEQLRRIVAFAKDFVSAVMSQPTVSSDEIVIEVFDLALMPDGMCFDPMPVALYDYNIDRVVCNNTRTFPSGIQRLPTPPHGLFHLW